MELAQCSVPALMGVGLGGMDTCVADSLHCSSEMTAALVIGYIQYKVRRLKFKEKKRWQGYTEELYKKGLNGPDNYSGVVTHLETDILECEVKWALMQK